MDEFYKEGFHASLKKFVSERAELSALKSTSMIDKKNMSAALQEYLKDAFGAELWDDLSDVHRI